MYGNQAIHAPARALTMRLVTVTVHHRVPAVAQAAVKLARADIQQAVLSARAEHAALIIQEAILMLRVQPQELRVQ